MLLNVYFHMLSDGAAFTNVTQSRSSLRSYANSCHYRERFLLFHNRTIISSAILLRSLSVNYV